MDDQRGPLPDPGPNSALPGRRPSRADAEQAVRTLIRWAGDDPDREGLADTPSRVAKAYHEFFRGYAESPENVLGRVFEEVGGYDDAVIVRDIRLESHCEHHMVPIVGSAHIGYLPGSRVVGISKLARLVDVYAKRLQTQETMTAQIADALQKAIEPRGVGVIISARHMCMTTRGVHKTDSITVTCRLLGSFRDDDRLRREFMRLAE